MKKQLWKNILQFIVTIATSIISAIGVTSCVGHYSPAERYGKFRRKLSPT